MIPMPSGIVREAGALAGPGMPRGTGIRSQECPASIAVRVPDGPDSRRRIVQRAASVRTRTLDANGPDRGSLARETAQISL